MVESSNLDGGGVVLPIVAPDSQPDYSWASDATATTPTVLESDSEEDARDLGGFSEQDMDRMIAEVANQPVPDTQGEPLHDHADEQYQLGGQWLGPQMSTSDCMRSRSPIRGQWGFIDSGRESPPSSPRQVLANRHFGMAMSSGEMFRHILTLQSDMPRVLVIAGEEHMTEAAEPCNRALGSIVRSGRQFYIGITERHSRRWEEHQEAAPGMWARMVILIEAPNSRLAAQLERRFIAQWGASLELPEHRAWRREGFTGSASLCILSGRRAPWLDTTSWALASRRC
jgi:hypothetical protein